MFRWVKVFWKEEHDLQYYVKSLMQPELNYIRIVHCEVLPFHSVKFSFFVCFVNLMYLMKSLYYILPASSFHSTTLSDKLLQVLVKPSMVIIFLYTERKNDIFSLVSPLSQVNSLGEVYITMHTLRLRLLLFLLYDIHCVKDVIKI